MTRHLLVTNDFPPKVGGIQCYLWELWRRLDPDSSWCSRRPLTRAPPDFDAAQAALGVRIERIRRAHPVLPDPAVAGRVRIIAGREVDASAGGARPRPAPRAPRSAARHALRRRAARRGGDGARAPARIPPALAHVLAARSLVISAGGYPAAEGARATAGRLPPVVDVPPGWTATRFVPMLATTSRPPSGRLGLPAHRPARCPA